jgi:ABC-type phosphate/phosphonate transport system permease subunit
MAGALLAIVLAVVLAFLGARALAEAPSVEASKTPA